MVCACGCGETTAKRFVHGHNLRMPRPDRRHEGNPNPSGLCMCGCGGRTKIAARSVGALGIVKGKPYPYLRSHKLRKSYEVDPVTGCWNYQGRERGQVMRDGKLWCIYRWVFTQTRGVIPDGHVLHHTCENPRCVNPEHLMPMLPEDHSRLHAPATPAWLETS